ncbi:MAG: hypothetical protein QM647_00090 [Asticcacaulis sp.]|uniref:hypothetical protein n=1 Tax=Asticcacaulis sp. TaxID=1872648 RepID=UPI0039E4B68F
MFFLWYCFDDHLAALLRIPQLGDVPWWCILMLNLAVMPLTGSLTRSLRMEQIFT